MRGFTLRNDMVQRVTTLTLCYLLAATLFSSPTSAEEEKKEDISPKNENKTEQKETPKNEMSRRMGHDETLQSDSSYRHPRQQLRQYRRQQFQPQQQQQHTETVYIAMEQEGSAENQRPRRKGPRNGRRRRVRGRKLHRAPQATHYYSPAVVQSMPLPSQTTHTVTPARYRTAPPTHLQDINSATATNDPKNYAFAYAVRDTDPYNGDDFSHKEARDGKLTMGEYKVVLPDGRTQVVRYTAGSNQGFNADVTYEDEEAANKGRGGKHSFHHSSPTSSVHKQYASPPSPSHSAQAPYKNPIYFSRPVKAPQIVFRSHDNEYKNHHQLDNQISVSATPSPNVVFKAGPRRRPRLPPPSQATFINGLVPSTRPFHGPKSIYDNMQHNPPKHISASLKFGKPLGHLEHDKSPRAGPLRSPRPAEATPTQLSYTTRPTLISSIAPTQFDTHSAYSHPGNELSVNTVSSKYQPYKFKITSQTPTSSYSVIDSPNENVSPTPFTSYSPTGKSKLVPIEYFKAGPATDSSPLVNHGKVRKGRRRLRPRPHHQQNLHQEQFHTAFESKPSPTPLYHISTTPQYHISSTSASYEDDHSSQHHHQRPIYRQEQDHHDHNQIYHNNRQQPFPVSTYASPTVSTFSSPSPSQQPQQPTQQSYFYNSLHGPGSHEISHSSQGNLPKVKSSLATYTSSYPGLKSPFFYKSPPQLPVGRPIRPSSGGLMYLETPSKGPRPTSVVGVKETLDRIPVAQTTTHPYEVGSADYGKSVGYTTFDSEQRDHKKPFTPSEEIPPEFVPHLNHQYENHHSLEDGHHLQHHQVDDIHSFMREYLIDNTKDSIVGHAPDQQLDTRLGNVDRDAEYAFQFNI